MKLHTSFKIGGPADFFIAPKNIEKLVSTIKLCSNEKIPYYIMGNGSNLLVSDKGFRGVILQIYKNFNEVRIVDDRVYAQAGVLLSRLSKDIYEASLEGFEFASGIPGTLGGAVFMNAGAYGGEMKHIVEEVTVVTHQGDFINLPKEALALDYRSSILQKEDYVAISATLKLKKGEKELIKRTLDELNHKRKTKQPLEMPSAGSTFKRPEGYFAGKLIMDAGLRGHCIGGAQVSEKHCGFVVNKGSATAEDVILLMEHVREVVKEMFGVELEPEVKLLGE
ncbi:MAG: UDP-N-acetylenolpyruvoylglucosamine reductase [Firmicutes bacterium HGW-Firmicutes-1]|nr:MAG: UDP-N-acetylenolpyruvoylglucosamine reductase [Firmicutes bacterium HGW-Firmicutes-1]